MSRDDLASTQPARTTGLGRTRRDRATLRVTARRRAAVLCALLGLALTTAGWPEFFWGILKNGRPGVHEDIPEVPADVLLRTAEAAHAKGRLEESARLHGLLLAQHPDHPLAENALAVRVQTLLALGRVEEAHASLRELQVRNPRSEALPEALLEMGFEQMRQGRLQHAVRTYTDVVAYTTQDDPAASRPLTVPGTWARRKAVYDEKTRILAERTEMERVARFNLAVCHDVAGHQIAALRAYELFVRRFPTDARLAEACFRMGVVARELGQLQDAVRHFARVWGSENADGRYRAASIYQAGLCLETLRRRDDAQEAYGLAKDLEPQDDPCRLASLNRLALLVRDREPLQALELYRDLAENSRTVVERALAQQNLLALQTEAAVAVVH